MTTKFYIKGYQKHISGEFNLLGDIAFYNNLRELGRAEDITIKFPDKITCYVWTVDMAENVIWPEGLDINEI